MFLKQTEHSLSFAIQSTLSEKGITLKYHNLKFAKDGKLTTIEYHVTKDKCGAADKN